MEFYVCIFAKGEHPYVQEWVEHYLAIGVKQIYFYDNDWEHPHSELLAPFGDRIVSVPWHDTSPIRQISAYNDCILTLRKKPGDVQRFCGFFDMDEFLVPNSNADIVSFLAQNSDYDKIQIPWRLIGANGHIARPSGGVVENFTKECSTNPKIRYSFKSIVGVQRVLRASNVHTICAMRNCLYHPPFTVNHYITKSWDEYIGKLRRGSVSRKLYNINDFFVYNPDMCGKIEVPEELKCLTS